MIRLLNIFFLCILFSCKPQNQENEIEKNTKPQTKNEKLNPIIGERIDGPANIRDSINGKLLFSLNDNVLVETTPFLNNWCDVGLFVNLAKNKVVNDKILPNQNLYNRDGELIGKTIDSVEILMGDEVECLIYGVTYKNNIKPYSIPEKVLLELLKKPNLNEEDIKQYIMNFNFQKYTSESSPKGIEEFFIYQSLLVDISPRDRISLLLKDGKLIGVVHYRNLETEYYKTYDLIRGHKLTITSNLTKQDIDSLISNRINFYNSID